LNGLTIQATRLNVRGNLYDMWIVWVVSLKQSNTIRSICWAGYNVACSMLQEWQEKLKFKILDVLCWNIR
jgi:hypothetical protein